MRVLARIISALMPVVKLVQVSLKESAMKRILIIGGGFAGLWSAASAARQLAELGEVAEITLINPDDWHSIRVRNYEEDLSDTRIALSSVLAPIGVRLLIGEALSINTAAKLVTVRVQSAVSHIGYDKLVLASGSQLMRPSTPGLAEHTFDVDSYKAALKLQHHIDMLATKRASAGQFTALVVGSGATGVEIACELPTRLRKAAAKSGLDAEAPIRVILADRGPVIARGLGGGQPVIERACLDLGIELLPNFSLASVDAEGATLSNGERIDASTIVWCAGMRASNLTENIAGEFDQQGRLKVDECMRVRGIEDIFAAGDTAHALIDGDQPSVMSCQHARPMGRFAGHNAVNELFGMQMEPLTIDWYTNIIDLGSWGAVYTQGWDRAVVAHGQQAKETKRVINRERIYPPREGCKKQIFAAASLELQRPPQLKPIEMLE